MTRVLVIAELPQICQLKMGLTDKYHFDVKGFNGDSALTHEPIS